MVEVVHVASEQIAELVVVQERCEEIIILRIRSPAAAATVTAIVVIVATRLRVLIEQVAIVILRVGDFIIVRCR
jgi:hypothetical protein|tara:strand:- start:2524 stop:2745 length:222 start_codon:yes stop_codon:yes gene_type:complete